MFFRLLLWGYFVFVCGYFFGGLSKWSSNEIVGLYFKKTWISFLQSRSYVCCVRFFLYTNYYCCVIFLCVYGCVSVCVITLAACIFCSPLPLRSRYIIHVIINDDSLSFYIYLKTKFVQQVLISLKNSPRTWLNEAQCNSTDFRE